MAGAERSTPADPRRVGVDPAGGEAPEDGNPAGAGPELEEVTIPRRALFTFRPPPVTVSPASDGFGSTLFNSVLRTPATELEGNRDSTSAAAPVTCGVAIEVPLKYRY